MDIRQFHSRILGTLVVLGALLVLFFTQLYDLQVVHGDDYRSQSVRKITKTETVAAARGEILDRYGRVLVTNRVSYQVTLDTGVMGAEARRNPNLLALLAICREQGVAWNDAVVPISMTEPFVYTQLSEGAQARWETFLARMKWTEAAQEGPEALLAKMREFYQVAPEVSPEEGRALVGVLCEVRIRSMDILRSSYVFARDVDIDFISTVKEQSLVGVVIDPTTVRVCNTPYAAHLLGRVGLMDGDEWSYYQTLGGYSMNDSVGKDGVELAFEEYLRGRSGRRAIDTNVSGKIVGETWLTDQTTGEVLEPKPGNNITLTLDIRLQEACERALSEGIAKLESEYTKGGAVVVTEVKTGGVLAMASYPTFDLSAIYSDAALYEETANDPLNPFWNRAAREAYSPGSTFKMVVGTAALEEGLVTPTEKILDTGRFQYPAGEKYPYGEYHPACWYYLQYGGSHGMEDMAHAIKDSCNVYFYTMGDRLGISLIDKYAEMFGLGKATGFELPETVGQVAGPETSDALGMPWYGGDLLSASIGQGNTQVTPLQMANYISTLVNGGSHYSAHILHSVSSSDYSQVLYEREPELLDSLNIRSENLEAVKQGMLLLTTEGSVRSAFKDLGVAVGAKTGTAQVGREDTNSNAVMVCFAPYDDPEIAISIVVERGGGGTDIAGIAVEILSYYFSAQTDMEGAEQEGVLLR